MERAMVSPAITTIGTPAQWTAFLLIVFLLLALDLGIFHRKAHAIGVREALIWSAFWIFLALCFNGWVFLKHGRTAGLHFLTAYLLEKALSVDNLFVFMLLFGYFAVPPAVQHRVLYWGILGALVTRGIFIVGGATLIHYFDWVLYFFGAFLVYTGIKLVAAEEKDEDVRENAVVRFFRRHVRVTESYEGTSFFVRRNGAIWATPLLIVLVALETTDVAFATDSIPAVFGISKDPFIVFTSNIFAVLGLRALYFAIVGLMATFRYLNYGLGLVLAFIGVKMIAVLAVEHIKGREWAHRHLPNEWMQALISLGVIALLIGGSIVASMLHKKK